MGEAVPVHEGNTKRYHVLMELARGGNGVVSAAISRGMGGFSKLVVLKSARPELDIDSETVRNFLNEARLHARMSHPNVVEVYEVTEQEGLPVIVMEYLDGLHLGKVLSRAFPRDDYDLRVVLSILCNVLDGLHYAHTLSDFRGNKLGIVHRDVTPHNVMVSYDGRVKLLDFGIAKLQLQSGGETRTGVIKGKLGYMPPEQAEGATLDCRADVFAVGVMIWEMVARRRMWGTQGEADVFRQLLMGEIPRLEDAAPDTEPELLRICNKALAVDPEERYESAGALLSDLRAFLQSQGGIADQSRIAELIENCCGDLRGEAKAQLDEQLARFSEAGEERWQSSLRSGDKPSPMDQSATGTSSSQRRVGTAFATGTTHGMALPDAQTIHYQTQKRRSRAWIAGLLAVAAAVGVWALKSEPPPPSAVAVAPEVPVTPTVDSPVPAAPPPVVVENKVQVQIRAEPKEAQLLLDGEPLPNPYSAEVLKNGSQRELIVRAKGYREQRRLVQFESDMELALHLERVPKVEPKPRRRARPTKVRRKPTPKPSTKVEPKPVAPKPACATPYYFDANGIKKYRRECLK